MAYGFSALEQPDFDFCSNVPWSLCTDESEQIDGRNIHKLIYGVCEYTQANRWYAVYTDWLNVTRSWDGTHNLIVSVMRHPFLSSNNHIRWLSRPLWYSRSYFIVCLVVIFDPSYLNSSTSSSSSWFSFYSVVNRQVFGFLIFGPISGIYCHVNPGLHVLIYVKAMLYQLQN